MYFLAISQKEKQMSYIDAYSVESRKMVQTNPFAGQE